MPGELELAIAGARFAGWKEVRISRSITTIAGAFELRVSERWSGLGVPRRIREGDSCEIRIGSETILRGYVDDVSASYDAVSHSLGVRGRDATGDLVDCSVASEPGEWNDRNVEQITRDLIGPYDVTLQVEADTGKTFETFRVQESETVFAAIDRLCRHRGLLAMSDGIGHLVLTRASTERVSTPLIRGRNIKRASLSSSTRERFSTYEVKGQKRGSDTAFGEVVAAVSGSATDPVISRHRPFVLVAEEPGDGLSLLDRARWEANRRAARGARVVIEVQGWEHSSGLWEPNRLVQVQDDALELDDELLIASVTLSLGPQGRRTELELGRREAFDVLALPEPKSTPGLLE